MKLKYKLEIYKSVINDLANGNIQLSDEQFEYLKKLGLKEGLTIGMHNTTVGKIESFFETGLYNNEDYLFAESCDLSNTIAYDEGFYSRLSYWRNSYVTIILMIPNDVLEGKKGIFERLEDGGWGIPPEYIVGAFKKGKIYENPNYNEKYYNPDSKLYDSPDELYRTYADRKEEISICTKAFYDYKKLKDNSMFKEINKRINKNR